MTKWERPVWGICGLGLVLLTLLFPEGNYWDFFFAGLGFLYLIIAIVAKEKS